MIRKTPFFDWEKVFDETKEECKIGYDFLTSNDINILYNKEKRLQTNYYIDVFINKGNIVIEIDMKEYLLDSPSFILMQPGNSFQIISFSSDLSINIFVASKHIRNHFLDSFGTSVSLHNSIRLKCYSHFNKKEADIMMRFVNELNEVSEKFKGWKNDAETGFKSIVKAATDQFTEFSNKITEYKN